MVTASWPFLRVRGRMRSNNPLALGKGQKRVFKKGVWARGGQVVTTPKEGKGQGRASNTDPLALLAIKDARRVREGKSIMTLGAS